MPTASSTSASMLVLKAAYAVANAVALCGAAWARALALLQSSGRACNLLQPIAGSVGMGRGALATHTMRLLFMPLIVRVTGLCLGISAGPPPP